MVIDDESHALELLSDYIQAIPQLQLIKTYQCPLTALMESQNGESFDFIFMDIDMPQLSGIELAKSFRPLTTFLVFTTAHTRYAVDAFEVRADHYLLKPIAMNKFVLTVDLLLKSRQEAKTIPAMQDSSFYIRSDQKNKLIKICPEEILLIEGLKNYVLITTLHHKHIAYLTMKEVEMALNASSDFIRVHKSFIVSKKFIERVEGRNIRLVNNQEVPIGDTYRQEFNDYINGKVFLSGR